MSDDATDTPSDQAADEVEADAPESSATAEGGEGDTVGGDGSTVGAWASDRDSATSTKDKAKGKGEADVASGAGGDADAKPSDAERAARKAKADAIIAERQVARRTVTSRRVTPKGGASATPSTPSKARDAKKTEEVVSRAPVITAKQVYDKGPSPWWVPAIMFALLILGALIIMTNYMGVFGDASNVRLVIGLAFILGGIIAATQYR